MTILEATFDGHLYKRIANEVKEFDVSGGPGTYTVDIGSPWVKVDLIPLLKEDFLKSDPKVRSVFATQVGELSDQLAILTNLTCKKYIIAGEQDPTVNPDYLEQHKTKAKQNQTKAIKTKAKQGNPKQKPKNKTKTKYIVGVIQ